MGRTGTKNFRTSAQCWLTSSSASLLSSWVYFLASTPRECQGKHLPLWRGLNQLPPCSALTIGGPSLQQALCLLLQTNVHSLDQAMMMSLARLDMQHGLLLVSGNRCYILARDMLQCMCTQQHNFQALLACIITSPCKCKCKTSILTSKPFKTADILLLDTTPWGSKIIAETATMLGFILRGRISKYEWQQATSIDEINWVGQKKCQMSPCAC